MNNVNNKCFHQPKCLRYRWSRIIAPERLKTLTQLWKWHTSQVFCRCPFTQFRKIWKMSRLYAYAWFQNICCLRLVLLWNVCYIKLGSKPSGRENEMMRHTISESHHAGWMNETRQSTWYVSTNGAILFISCLVEHFTSHNSFIPRPVHWLDESINEWCDIIAFTVQHYQHINNNMIVHKSS